MEYRTRSLSVWKGVRTSSIGARPLRLASRVTVIDSTPRLARRITSFSDELHVATDGLLDGTRPSQSRNRISYFECVRCLDGLTSIVSGFLQEELDLRKAQGTLA